ncbi:MAG: hypothetical protein ABSG54_00975 [Terriglobia bacterium]|jgi:hypothetical protein
MEPQTQPFIDEVSSNHRRILSVRLRLLEEDCFQLLDLFHTEARSLCERPPLQGEKAEEFRELSAHLRAVIAGMKAELKLEPARLDPQRVARALLTSMSVAIEELYPEYLHGYGKVPAALASYLRSRVQEMLAIMRKINRALETVTKSER